LAAFLDLPAADSVAAFRADFLTAFVFFAVLLAFLAARFGAARSFLRFSGAGATATGGTIMGSETRPSAASGM